jgi:class 3 adenylate cyclase
MTVKGYDGPTLPAELKVRLGMHFGVVFQKKDPVTGTTNYFGEAVARAARIEPITKEGRTFVSEEFAAELALDPDATATADYVGEMDAAKNYGKFRLYRIRAK